MKPYRLVAKLLLCFTSLSACAVSIANSTIKVDIEDTAKLPSETFFVRSGNTWIPALSTRALMLVRTDAGMQACSIARAGTIKSGLLVTGICPAGSFEQRISLTSDDDVLHVSTRLTLPQKEPIHSVEDRYDFLPERHRAVDEHVGPLDFVWSQNIKSEADDLIPTGGFKSPVVMMQQGEVFAGILPQLNDRHVETRALDLDVTSGPRPWMSFGAIASEPHGHSYFRRSLSDSLTPIANVIEYQYSLVLSAQPASLGYRRVVRLLWERSGHPELLRSANEQQNVIRPELASFASWRYEAWNRYADSVYTSFQCGAQTCGTLKSNRNFQGDWDHPEPDAWFNAWFQALRTAYGWYLHGRSTNDAAMMAKAGSVLNLALSSPQKDGAFPTIYLVDQKKWIPGDGWAGYSDSYHAFSMSWTAYWMLRWADDLSPQRKPEILNFAKAYGDFLVAHQQASGVIPSWYYAASMQPRAEFRDFNAETAVSALFLATLGKDTGERRYIAAAENAMAFIVREVLPRQRWFDFETYLSCARKDYSFFDPWTAQYPQNNLAEIQAPQAMLALYQATGKREYLVRGRQMLDYLLLTQQVWSNPHFTPDLLGGFTTQNTDAEWSDARQSYAATLLSDYYQATGDMEYLERAVAAARSTFAVAPWENWAHTGYLDEPGAMTGFHWGTGSAMTSVEIMQPLLGDALIDYKAGAGVGFDHCTIDDVQVRGNAISFRIESPDKQRLFMVRFRGLTTSATYQVSWNDGALQQISGSKLMQAGLQIQAVN